MPRYMLAVHTSGSGEPVSEEAARQSYERLVVIEQDMARKGAWVFSARLDAPETGAVVSAPDGELLTTDGPFVESKEHFGGFYLIEAADLDEALGWAARVTAAIHAPIEVRPLAAYADEPMS